MNCNKIIRQDDETLQLWIVEEDGTEWLKRQRTKGNCKPKVDPTISEEVNDLMQFILHDCGLYPGEQVKIEL